MYELNDYCAMIADSIRMDAYRAALEAAVRPGSVVLDIGTGTGICALLACRSGARRVYALETNPAVLLGPQMAAANGYGDRIEFRRCLSTEWEAPEPIDVMVSDLRGVMPLTGRHIPSIIDARQRLLAPGGIQIPQRDHFWATVVHTPREHRRVASIWTRNRFDLDLSAARDLTVNRWSKASTYDMTALTEPVLGGVLDYRTVDQPDLRLSFDWQGPRAGEAHGLSLWFDAELLDGIGFSNRPGRKASIYGSAFFPWPDPIALLGDERIEVEILADLFGDHHVWRWYTRIQPGEASQAAPRSFQQTTLASQPLDMARLRLRAPSSAPGLGAAGRLQLDILRRLDAGETIRAVAEAVAAERPERFPDWKDALDTVAALAERFADRGPAPGRMAKVDEVVPTERAAGAEDATP